MNQAELNKIFEEHSLWLESDGVKGNQANLTNDHLNKHYSNKENVSTLNLHKGGGFSYAAGRSTYVESDELSGTLIQCANLDFSGANLTNAILEGAIFYNCKMYNTHLNTNLNSTVFVKSDLYLTYMFSTTDFSNTSFISCDIANILFQNKTFAKSNLSRSNFKNCLMQNSDFSEADLYGTKFTKCTLSECRFIDANIESGFFEDCSLENTDFSGAKLNKSTIRNLSIDKIKIEPVKNKLFGKIKHLHNGLRLQGVYGDPLLEKNIRNDVFVEAVSSKHPLIYKLWLLSSDCGRSTSRWALWAITLVLFFALLYTYLGASEFIINPDLNHLTLSPVKEFSMFVYYSVVTFTTLGFGDITPKSIESMIAVIAEVILGYLTLGILISLVANKLGK